MRLDERSDGARVRLRVGDRLELALPENPSTGFRWQWTEPGAPVCRLEEDRFEPGGPGVGARGHRLLVLAVAGPGAARLALVLRRSWEPEAARAFTVEVEAAPATP
ncbi:MAG TPA: protease inhibitor I42 family protein [Anaeromyxobacter sp.]|nr:protease inhibitor I42 family protein [Anaeromyxobacter sp.]